VLGELEALGVVEVDEAFVSPLLFVDAVSLLDFVSESPLLSELFTSVFSPLFSDLASGSLSLSE
jgi:hypothetical protein